MGARGEDAHPQVLRRDRTTGVTTLVSRTPAGAPGNAWSGVPDISDDGRFVVFESHATDLVAGPDRNDGGSDIYLFDAADGGLRRVSVTSTGEQPAIGESATPAISGTGRVVAFSSTASLDAPPGHPERRAVRRSVFVRDLVDGVTRRISASLDRDGPNGESYFPAISGEGRRVAFVSTATNLDDDARARRQENVYLHDDRMPKLKLLSRSTTGGAADGASRYPAVSADGRYVLFSSDASNLHCTDRCGVSADLNLVMDVYRVDTVTGMRIASAAARSRGTRGGTPARGWPPTRPDGSWRSPRASQSTTPISPTTTTCSSRCCPEPPTPRPEGPLRAHPGRNGQPAGRTRRQPSRSAFVYRLGGPPGGGPGP